MLSASDLTKLGPAPPYPTKLLWKLNKILFVKCRTYSRCSVNINSLQTSPKKEWKDKIAVDMLVAFPF